jgi:hypothetical protein
VDQPSGPPFSLSSIVIPIPTTRFRPSPIPKSNPTTVTVSRTITTTSLSITIPRPIPTPIPIPIIPIPRPNPITIPIPKPIHIPRHTCRHEYINIICESEYLLHRSCRGVGKVSVTEFEHTIGAAARSNDVVGG